MAEFVLRTNESQEKVMAAIDKAEHNTSGEIRVHVESYCKGDAVERAIEVFNKLKMGETALKNGVLIYIAYESHKLAIIGDTGINEKVYPDYWDDIYNDLKTAFAASDITDGLCRAIDSIGIQLKSLFPYKSDDVNEQTNEVSFDK